LAAHTGQDSRGAQLGDHFARGFDAERREPVSHILECFGKDSAEPERHHWTEYGIVDDADDRLDAVADHFRYEQAVELGGGRGKLDARKHHANFDREIFRVANVQLDAASLGLMLNVA